MRELSIKECVSYGWRTFTSRPWFFIGTSAVLFLAGIVAHIPETLTRNPDSRLTVLAACGFLISVGLSMLVSMGRTALYLRAHDAVQESELSDLWHPRPYWKFVGAAILVGVGTVVGLILLIVPGIIFGVMTCFTLYIVLEKGIGPIQAIKESARLTKGNRWNLLGLGCALLAINIIGTCLLLVGLLASLPISALAAIHAYRTLAGTAPAIVTEEVEA